MTSSSKVILKNKGYCPICDQDTQFISNNAWLRDHYLCINCNSIPRERALIRCIKQFYPGWRSLKIHESSPAKRGASLKLQQECKSYTSTQFFPSFPLGVTHFDGWRNENLESQTFANESFDLVVTQDVMEHIFNPEKAFVEIARTLKPGGSHIFTVPLVRENHPSKIRAKQNSDNQIIYLEEANYHGNPIDDKGSLVTMDWGYDICEFILKNSGLCTTIVQIDNLSLGIRAKLIDVLISRKTFKKIVS